MKFLYLHRTSLVIALGFFVVLVVVGGIFFIRSLFLGSSDLKVVETDRNAQLLEDFGLVGRDLPPFPDLRIDDPFGEIIINELDAPAPVVSGDSYVVKHGDTLWAIAETHLESPYHYHSLVTINRISNPDLIVPGQVLALSLEGVAVSLPESTVQSGRVQTTPSTYAVKSGDSLWSIAERTMQDPEAWKYIYHLNHELIGDNPNLIYPHQILLIPEVQSTSTPPPDL